MKQLFQNIATTALCLFFLYGCFNRSLAQSTGLLAGKVRDIASNRPLKNVLVKISETGQTTHTNSRGEFEFTGLPEGVYTLLLQLPGYGRTIVLDLPVIRGETTYKEIFLQKSAREGEKYYIGGIEVTAERDLLPEKPATTTKITAGELEHIQASSLGDILELVPGQKFTNPGLENVKQIRLRTTETTDAADRNAALGTQIIIDGVPVSNNANMQLDTRLNTGATYRVTVNSGIDLRRIPAENIESVEIIRGIPSVRYGDLTAGTVVVRTQTGYQPFRAKYKYNPRNKELNADGGYRWRNTESNFFLNYARSQRNIRVPGDYYERLAGQLNLRSYFQQKKMQWLNRFYFSRIFDEQEVREGDITQTERNNRSYTIRWNSQFFYHWNNQRRFEALLSVNQERENSFYRSIISRDLGIISDRMTEGTQEGYFVSVYRTELKVKGRAWNLLGRLEYQSAFRKWGTLNQWMIGARIQHELNNGPGRQFDPRYPPRNTANEGDRPRSYSSIPALTQLTFYFQDEITGHLGRDFTFQLGLRYDLFDPYRLDWQAVGRGNFPLQSHHGNYLSPRANLVFYLSPHTQLRMGYGKTAKIPPLSMIYPNPAYFDIVDSMYYDVENPANRFALVTTYIFDRTREDLQAATRDKWEISFDRRIGWIGVSLTAFHEQLHNGFNVSEVVPVSFNRYRRPDWPEGDTAIPTDTLLLRYTIAQNSVESVSRGVEVSLSTKQLPYWNTSLRIDAAYHYTKGWYQENHFQYALTPRHDPYLNETVLPFWKPVSSWSDRLIIHYRFDTVAKPLGLWFTLAIQQIALERDQFLGLEDSSAVGYYRLDGERVLIPENRRDDPQYSGLRRTYEDYMYRTETRPNLWLINLRVTKGLWPGAEVSFFVNNLLNDRPLYQRSRVPEGSRSYVRRNPEIFYGVEMSMVVDDFIRFLQKY